MKILFRGLAAAVCATALVAQPALAGPTASVRVEGWNGTVVPATTVTTGDGVFQKSAGAPNCSRSSAAGALEVATAGDWSGGFDENGQRVERIRHVNLPFADQQRFWGFYVNDRFATQGACAQELQPGDEVLFVQACYFATTECWSGAPLDLKAPATARPGEPFTVTVEKTYSDDFSANDVPAQGATVSGGGATATTGADGRATLTIGQRGVVDVTASTASNPRETVQVCISDGADGYCGNPTPAGTTVAGGAPAAAAADRTAPRSRFANVREGRVYRRATAPRVLRGSVDESGGVHMVKLKITRTDGRRCSTWSRTRERFVRRPCGASKGWWFRIGDRADWEYQLAERLPRGRYVLDVNAIDKAFNRDDERRRGGNRVVFRVR